MRGNPASPQRPLRLQGLPSLPSIFSDTYLPNPFRPEFLDQMREPWAPNRLDGQKETPFWHGIYVVLPGGLPNGKGRYWCWSFVWPPRSNRPAKPPGRKPPGGTTPKPSGSSRAPTKVTKSEVTPSRAFTPSPKMDATKSVAPESPPGQSTPRTTEENTLIPRSGPPLTTEIPGVTDVPSTDAETTSGQEIENSGPYTTPFSSYPKATSGEEITNPEPYTTQFSSDPKTTSVQEFENAGPHTTPFSTSELATISELPLTSTSWSETTEGTAQQTSAISENEASDTDNTTASIDTGLNEVRPSVDFGPSGVLVNGGVGVEMRNYTVRYPGVIKDN
nr:polycystic kidney disease protein 1-like 3 [Rhipicephalus microplus]